MNVTTATATPPQRPALSSGPPLQASLDAYSGGVLTEPRPNRLWGVPVVAAVTGACAGFGALSGLSVAYLGIGAGIPAAVAGSALLSGAAMGALAAANDNSRKTIVRFATIGAAAGAGAGLVGSVAASLSSFPVIAGASAAAVAGLAVAAWAAFR